MTLSYLIDTDWVIHWLDGHEGIGRRLNEVKEQGVALSVISLAELYEGVYYSAAPETNERQLINFLHGVTLMGIDVETSQAFGRERGRLRAARARLADFDLLIERTQPAGDNHGSFSGTERADEGVRQRGRSPERHATILPPAPRTRRIPHSSAGPAQRAVRLAGGGVMRTLIPGTRAAPAATWRRSSSTARGGSQREGE